MNRVHGDLRDYRYLNALRRRDPVLRALRDAKAILKGEGDVVSDRSAAMPKYVRQYIADAAATELPAGFRQPLRQYYKKLSEQSE